MDDFKCMDCGATFDDPIITERREDMNGEGAWMTWYEYHCPECFSEELELNDAETD